ncbi:MAG: transcription antitermination factor NusB [Francisellaceae bacterium]
MSIKIKERRRARFHAIQALYQHQLAHNSFDELKRQFYEDNANRHPVEWDFFYRLIDGTAKHLEQIDTHIATYAANRFDSINSIDLAILRLGAYELLDCFDIPYQVIINEYVDQAKTLGTQEGHRFVNGLLDRLAGVLRNKNEQHS